MNHIKPFSITITTTTTTIIKFDDFGESEVIDTIVISGFPGVGKSHLFKELGENEVSDSDSSKFPKEDFPQNYIDHIKSLIGKKKYILTSTHKEVLDELEKNEINYTLVHPEKKLKKEYLKRYEERGSPKEFVKLLDSKWNDFMDDLDSSNPTKRIILKKGEFLDVDKLD